MRNHALLILGCVCWLGCTPGTSQPANSKAPAADDTSSSSATDAATSAIPGLGSAMQGKPGASSVVETERVTAEKGVGAKGRSLDGESGMLVTPVKAFFSVQEKLAFEVQLKQAMDLYKASNGNFPKSQAEFDTHIASQVKLPELPAGHKYVYDPQQGELQVERPK